MVKICSHCKIEKEISFYYKNKHRKDRLQNECKSCMNDSNTNVRFKKHYGITLEQAKILLKQQNNCCWLCNKIETGINGNSKKKQSLSLDHDHNTKKARKFLCTKCNHGLGLFNDDPELLTKAASYIINHRDLNG